ncbi:CRISPR system precrRNA processing endoribonuclease RAMP protein Cas6 [Streptomyces sp. NPDC012403]|uniref:CRISPR system precrRNA processing endoribonuclease RAMP protein Cas6 n=1 Tax=Streptomyces sp. NPDC012403 TaxID=3364831 RepID=UPI0036E217FF
MPSRWTLTLKAECPEAAAPVSPAHLHATTAHLVEPSDGDHHAQTKPYSVAPLKDLGNGRASLHIGWLIDTTRPRLDQRIGERIRFGPQSFRITGAHEDLVPYAALRHLPPARRALLTFCSPTYFARAGRWYPMPDPTLLYNGLARRWNTYAPTGLNVPDTTLDLLLNTVSIAFVDIRSGTLRLAPDRGKRVTFTGQAEYVLTNPYQADAAPLFTTLSIYANLAGVGAQTTHGLGAVEAELAE